jgi:hypothetical protein
MKVQGFSDMHVHELLEMYAHARIWLYGFWPQPDGVDESKLADKMIEITHELEARILRKGQQ